MFRPQPAWSSLRQSDGHPRASHVILREFGGGPGSLMTVKIMQRHGMRILAASRINPTLARGKRQECVLS